MSDLDNETVLAVAHRACFGSAPPDEDGKSPLCAELVRFRATKARSDDRTISRSAICNWFSPEKNAAPTREKSLAFIADYMAWAKGNNKIKDEVAYAKIMRTLASPGLGADSEGLVQLRIPQDWDGDKDTWKSALRLSGIYQIVRPSANRRKENPEDAVPPRDVYILECLAINPLARPDQRVWMYSHKAPDKNYIYRGDIHKSTWSLFSLIGRRNSNTSTRKSFRTLAICLEEGANCGCLSGMITRSMSDDLGFGKRIMATPFIAIKYPAKVDKINHDSLTTSNNPNIHLLDKELVIGKITAETPHVERMMEFCCCVFKELKYNLRLPTNPASHEHIVTSVADNQTVHKAVAFALQADKDLYRNWRKIAEDLLAS